MLAGGGGLHQAHSARFHHNLSDVGLAATAQLPCLRRLSPAAAAGRYSYSATGTASLRRVLPLCQLTLPAPRTASATDPVRSLPLPALHMDSAVLQVVRKVLQDDRPAASSWCLRRKELGPRVSSS